jgi:hypothetical protein
MALYVMVLRGATLLRGAFEGVGPEKQPFFRTFKKSTAPYKVHNMGFRYIKFELT